MEIEIIINKPNRIVYFLSIGFNQTIIRDIQLYEYTDEIRIHKRTWKIENSTIKTLSKFKEFKE